MTKIHSKKFALIDQPGSGKSAFASKLGRILSIPVHHGMLIWLGKQRDSHELNTQYVTPNYRANFILK